MIDKVTTTVINTKIIEIENKILEITNLATKAALNIKATGIENKIPDTSHFINTQAFNRLKKKDWCKNERSRKKLASSKYCIRFRR